MGATKEKKVPRVASPCPETGCQDKGAKLTCYIIREVGLEKRKGERRCMDGGMEEGMSEKYQNIYLFCCLEMKKKTGGKEACVQRTR